MQALPETVLPLPALFPLCQNDSHIFCATPFLHSLCNKAGWQTPSSLQDLALGRLDAVITDKIVGVSAKNEKGLEIKSIGDLLNEDRVSVAVSEGNKELADKINEAIQSMIDDGTYEKISMKWFNTNIMKK